MFNLKIYDANTYFGNIKIQKNSLCFTALEDGSSILLLQTLSPSVILLYYNKNDTGWLLFKPNVTKVTLNKNDFVKFKNKKSTLNLETGYYYFSMKGKISATGNINSLINYSAITLYCYKSLFLYCSGLIKAPELPATKLANSCYYLMFNRLYKFN